MRQEILATSRSSGVAFKDIEYSCNWTCAKYMFSVKCYLHDVVVGWREGLAQRGGAAALTAVRIVAFGVDDPVTPANLVKVHPHIHSLAQGAFPLLSGGTSSSDPCPDPGSILLVPFPTTGSRGGDGWGPIPVQGDVFGEFRRTDQSGGSLSLLGGVLFGEHHHHDPLSSAMVNLLRVLVLLLLPSWSPVLWGRRGRVLEQPGAEQGGDVEYFPGGRGVHGAGLGTEATQEEPLLWAGMADTLASLGVVEVHGGSVRDCEDWQADPQFRALDGVTRRDGGHVEGDRPSFTSLETTWRDKMETKSVRQLMRQTATQ